MVTQGTKIHPKDVKMEPPGLPNHWYASPASHQLTDYQDAPGYQKKPSRSATWQVWALKIILSSTLPVLPVLPILQDLLGTSKKQPATSQQIPAVRRGPAAGAKPFNILFYIGPS